MVRPKSGSGPKWFPGLILGSKVMDFTYQGPEPITCFVYQGTLIWNSLPESMQILSNLDVQELVRVNSSTYLKQSAPFYLQSLVTLFICIFTFSFCMVFYKCSYMYVYTFYATISLQDVTRICSPQQTYSCLAHL